MYDDFKDFLEAIENGFLEEDKEEVEILKKFCNFFGAEILYLLYGESIPPSQIGEYLLQNYKNDLGFLASPRFVNEFLGLYEAFLLSIGKKCPPVNLEQSKVRTKKYQILRKYSAYISKARAEGKLRK